LVKYPHLPLDALSIAVLVAFFNFRSAQSIFPSTYVGIVQYLFSGGLPLPSDLGCNWQQ